MFLNYFNSIKVQLKHEIALSDEEFIIIFQFHKGTIKTRIPALLRRMFMMISIP